MRDFRLKSLKHFERKRWRVVRRTHAQPRLQRHLLHIKPQVGSRRLGRSPDAIKNTYEKLGIPEAERQIPVRRDCAVRERSRVSPQPGRSRRKGVLFCDMDTAVREYPEHVRRWFGTLIPPNDNKFAALNSAVWSGARSSTCHRGSRLKCPAGVLPHQRRKHGPVRAHLDHRRRRLAGALHRRLLGSGVLDRLAPFGVVEFGSPPGGAHHLHDHSELVTNVYNW